MSDEEPFVVTLDGDWDVYRRDELADLLAGAYDRKRVVVDLTTTRYIDSTALGLFAAMRKQRRARGFSPARIVAPSEQIRRLLEIVKFNRIFSIHETVEIAIASFDGE